MAIGTCFIGWPNRIDEATLSGGSWEASLPLTNLQNTSRVTRVARSTDALAASTKVIFDLTQSRSLRVFALPNINFSSTATWRIKIGTTSGGAEVYDSGSLAVWRMTFDADVMEWQDAGWWEGMDDDEFVGAPFAAVHVAPEYKTGRYVTIEITDTTNPDGYVQFGRPFIGGGYQPTYPMSFDGMSDAWESLTRVVENASGSENYDERRGRRVARFVLEWLTLAEAKTVYEMQRRAGVSGDVFWIPDVDDAAAQQQWGFLGRMRQLNPVEYPLVNTRRAAFEIAEKL